jgi:hypothetical protein
MGSKSSKNKKTSVLSCKENSHTSEGKLSAPLVNNNSAITQPHYNNKKETDKVLKSILKNANNNITNIVVRIGSEIKSLTLTEIITPIFDQVRRSNKRYDRHMSHGYDLPEPNHSYRVVIGNSNITNILEEQYEKFFTQELGCSCCNGITTYLRKNLQLKENNKISKVESEIMNRSVEKLNELITLEFNEELEKFNKETDVKLEKMFETFVTDLEKKLEKDEKFIKEVHEAYTSFMRDVVATSSSETVKLQNMKVADRIKSIITTFEGKQKNINAT